MNRPLVYLSLGICTLAVLAGMLFLATPAVDAKPAAYKIDPGHSCVLFKIKHFGVSNFYGRFNLVEGTLNYDGESAAGCSVNVTIPVDSLDTNSADRDTHLKSPEFFDAATHKTMTFKSTKVAQTTSADHLDVTGDLTIRGVKKSVTIRMEKVGQGETRFGYKAGFEGKVTIKRSDFGMKAMIPALSDEVELILSFECNKQ